MLLVEQRIAKERFLEVFRECGVLRPALEEAGVTRGSLSSWLEHDVEFVVRYHDAERDAADFLELVALLRARDPAKWRDSVQLEAADGLAVTYTNDWRPRDDAEGATPQVADAE